MNDMPEYEDLTMAQVAEILNVNPNTLYARLAAGDKIPGAYRVGTGKNAAWRFHRQAFYLRLTLEEWREREERKRAAND